MNGAEIEQINRRAEALIDDHVQLMRALVDARKRHRLTQADVADRMGVSQPTVAEMERYDANPTLARIRRYALAVEVRITSTVQDDPGDQRCAADRAVTWYIDKGKGRGLLAENNCDGDVPIISADHGDTVGSVMARARSANASVVIVGVHFPARDEEVCLLRLVEGPSDVVAFEIGGQSTIGMLADAITENATTTVRIAPSVAPGALQPA